MGYYFSSESVSEGHPDKVADQISDAILDNILVQDMNSKVACETLVTTGQVIIAGEIKTAARINEQEIARRVINQIGYTKSDYKFDGESCGILTALHGQSPDINQGVERENPFDQGAGDQGMMFGYACDETQSYMPIAIDIAHNLLIELAAIRKAGKEMTYLRPDSKSQVTIEYGDDNRPKRIDTIVLSTQHDEFIVDANNQKEADNKMLEQIKKDVKEILIPRVLEKHPEYQALLKEDYTLHVNPTGKFVIGGPYGDTGLTGRKIIVDTYGVEVGASCTIHSNYRVLEHPCLILRRAKKFMGANKHVGFLLTDTRVGAGDYALHKFIYTATAKHYLDLIGGRRGCDAHLDPAACEILKELICARLQLHLLTVEPREHLASER